MRIFVAGATGVVGRRVVPLLLKRGWAVTAVARTAEKIKELGRLGARPEVVDLFDPAAVARAVEGHDVVCNLTTHIPSSNRAMLPFAWRQNDRIRRFVSRNLVEAAIRAGAGRYIQESFAPMYPSCGDRWIDEHSSVSPAPHVRSAITAEYNTKKFTEAGGQGVILRFAYFYGPDSHHTLDAIRMAKTGWAAAFGSPEGYISSIHTDDAARAVVAALSVPAGVYNVADDEPVTKREFFGALAGALGVPPPRFLPPFFARLAGSVGETLARSQRISNRHFKEQTGWSPAYPGVREGLPALVRQLGAGPPSSGEGRNQPRLSVERGDGARFAAGSRVRGVYGTEEAVEEYNSSYGFNHRYLPLLERGGMKVTGVDDDGGVRALELPDHPFFVATLFQPERSALVGRTHRLVRAFVSAASGVGA